MLPKSESELEGQLLQIEAPDFNEYFPPMQLTQVADEVAPENKLDFPAAHGVQESEDETECFPASHKTQTDAPAEEYEPASQGRHAADDESEYCPA